MKRTMHDSTLLERKRRKMDPALSSVPLQRNELEIRMILENIITMIVEEILDGVNHVFYIQGTTAKYRNYVINGVVHALKYTKKDLFDVQFNGSLQIKDTNNALMMLDENENPIGMTCMTRILSDKEKYSKTCFIIELTRLITNQELVPNEERRSFMKWNECYDQMNRHKESVFMFTSLLEPNKMIEMGNSECTQYMRIVDLSSIDIAL